MNFLILGDGEAETAWASVLTDDPEHQVVAAFPGFAHLEDIGQPQDFDEALAFRGVEAVVVGGDLPVRIEWLRRVAAAGLPAICLHPPGDDSEAYYQVALSRAETGAILIPDLPLRLHPGLVTLRQRLASQEIGSFRGLRHESSVSPDSGDLVRHVFSQIVDGVRSLLGEVETVTGTGDPPGERPTHSLVVQLRGPEARRAEVRIVVGPAQLSRLILLGDNETVTFEYHPSFLGASRIIHQRIAARPRNGTDEVTEDVTEIAPWAPSRAILDALMQAIAGRDARPNLLDGTRAMELAEATVRSLRRGRTVDLHYEVISEASSFKSVMTSSGCLILLGIMVALPIALAGPALGLNGTLYIAYGILPLLVVFLLLQSLRFAVREEPGAETSAGDGANRRELQSQASEVRDDKTA